MKKIVVLSTLLLMSVVTADTNSAPVSKEQVSENIKKERWERLIHAICMVESNCNDKAKNPKSSASGRFQMLKVYVDEVNRIKGRKLYSYKDRHNPKKAREIFDIYQEHHNPEKNIDRAILIHRGLKDKDYIRKVKEEMKNENRKVS